MLWLVGLTECFLDNSSHLENKALLVQILQKLLENEGNSRDQELEEDIEVFLSLERKNS